MKVIKDYRLKKDDITPQPLYITKGAEIVNILELDSLELALFVLCDKSESNTELRTFQVYDTWSTIYEDNIVYVGSIGTRHVIEIL